MKKIFYFLIILLFVFNTNQTVYTATTAINTINPNQLAIQFAYHEEVTNNSDGSKDVYTKTNDGKTIKQRTYNEKGMLIQDIDFNNKTKSIYSYKTGKLYQRYVGDNELWWYNLNTGNYIAKTVSKGNGICKTYGKDNTPFTGEVYGHMFGADYTLKYKNGDIDVNSIADALKKMSIIDDRGEFIAEPYYYFKFLKRILIADGELNILDSKAILGLQKIIDTH